MTFNEKPVWGAKAAQDFIAKMKAPSQGALYASLPDFQSGLEKELGFVTSVVDEHKTKGPTLFVLEATSKKDGDGRAYILVTQTDEGVRFSRAYKTYLEANTDAQALIRAENQGELPPPPEDE